MKMAGVATASVLATPVAESQWAFFLTTKSPRLPEKAVGVATKTLIFTKEQPHRPAPGMIMDRMSLRELVLLFLMLLGIACSQREQASIVPPGAGLHGLTNARLDSWEILGPGGGGTMMSPTISPFDSNLVVEHCDMTGAYITTDAGLSWRMFNLRSVVSCFAFDPGNRDVIYAGNMGLWRSENRGKTWSLIFPDTRKNTRELMSGDHADCSLLTDDPAYPSGGQEVNVDAIAVDPASSRNLYLALRGSSQDSRQAMLYASRDRGVTWSRIHTSAWQVIYALATPGGESSSNPDLCVVGEQGIDLRVGGNWEHRSGPYERRILGASIGRQQSHSGIFIYATTSSSWKTGRLDGGLFVSSNYGKSWRQSLNGLIEQLYLPGEGRAPQFGAIACSSQIGSVAYVGFAGLRLGVERESLFNGIAKTGDAGQHWTIVHKESNHPSPNLEGSWLDGRAPDGYPSIWFDTPYSLGVAPTKPDVCYATDLFRTYRTLDGGRSWKQVHSAQLGEDRWTTRGLDVTTCYGLHFDPFDARHAFITYADIGLFQSRDGGQSWMGSTEGIPNLWRNTTYWIVFDPDVKDLIWGGFSGTHDLPRPKMWRVRDPGRFTGGVAVSTDGGRRWSLSNQAMPETAVTHLLLDAKSRRGSRTLYACGFGRGVFKSADNGKTWVLKNDGIVQRQPFAWRLSQARDGTLYLVVARRSDEGRIGDADDGALYKSTDYAEHWVGVPLPSGTNGPTSLVVDPTDDHRLYLTAWGVDTPGPDSGGGVFLSTDLGQHWQPLFLHSQHVYDLTVNPRSPRTLYICGFDAAAYRSIDGGTHWSRIQGYNFKWGHRVMPDPVDPAKIYITTYGGSVWHGPGAGDPTAAEDILTPLRQE